MSGHPLRHLWAEAFAQPGKAVPVGGRVVCDDCDREYTDSKEEGGLIFQSKAICPCCGPKWLAAAAKYGEENFIRARCPAGQSFAAFVRAYRGPDAAIRVSVR